MRKIPMLGRAAPECGPTYAARAEEYDAVYRRANVRVTRAIEALAARALAGAQVLEIACGTGYWTHHRPRSAQRVGP
ncbi:MAG: hypothetical protein IPJ36_11685 [Simplicispira sp.]|nr:hypothetical protein [Simplicispira sp.]